MIELGEVTASPGAEPPEGPDDRPGPGVRRRTVRQYALAAIAVCTLLTVTGSVVPEPRGVRQLWSTPLRERDSVTLAGGSAFLSRTEDELTRITAHDLATGSVRWSVAMPGAVGWVQPVQDGGILLLPSNREVVQLGLGREEAIATEFHRETVALDARTGDVRWRTTGEPHTTAGETALLAEHTEQGQINRLRLVRVADGGTVWSRNFTGLELQTTAMRGDRPERLITASPSGEITVSRWDDGTVVTRARVPWVTARPDEGYFNDLSANGDYLVVNQSRPETVDQFIYRLDTMTELWRAPATNGYAFVCGAERLCLTEGNHLVARDLATGAQRWTLRSTGNLFPIAEDRLLADTGLDNGSPALIDAETGRLISSGGPGSTVWNSEVGDAILVLRSTLQPYGRTMVIRWDLRDGRQHLLGAIEAQTAQRCQAIPGYLVCSRDNEVQVTAVG